MKSFTITLISLMIMITSGYSQATSTGIAPIATDTAFNVSNDDIALVNHMVADLDACSELADSLFSEIKNHEILLKRDNVIIQKLQQDNSNLETTNSDITTLSESYQRGERKERIKKKWAKGFACFFGAIALIETGWIALTIALK
jgi:hypothetical protein